MITKRIHKQQNWKIFETALYIAMAAFLVFLGVKVYKNGTGTSSNGPRAGLKAVFSSILRKLEENGHPDLVKWILVVMIIVAVSYSLFKALMVLIQNKPEYTELGQSVCRQAEPGEDFNSLLEDIRLKRIKKISTRKSAWMNYLLLEDVDGNSMEAAFLLEENAEEALVFLKRHLAIEETKNK